jgi:uncharacterized repeat protein (TIGR01451 family)
LPLELAAVGESFMKTRRQKPTGKWKRETNFLARLAMVLLLSFSLVQNAFANIDNVATASGTYIGVSVVSGNSPVSIPVVLNAPTVELQKSATLNDQSGDGFAQVGETITYSFSVQNTGNVTLTNITLTDDTVPVTGGPIATFAPAAIDTTTFTATYSLTAADLIVGSVTNTATVNAFPPSGPDIEDVDVVVTTLSNAPIIAADDTVAGVNGAAGNANVINIFTNDTLAGNPATLSEVDLTVSVINPVPPELTLDLLTGIVGVLPGTPAATYDFAYTICEILNPTNCDNGLVTITVGQSVLVANPDNAGGINGTVGDPNVIGIFDNDLMNGLALDPNDINLTVLPGDPLPPELTLDPVTGIVGVIAGTPAGSYDFTYQICEKINPITNCVTAVVTIDVINDPTVTGTVYFDVDGNGSFVVPDTNAGANYIVELFDSLGAPLGNTTTNASGFYSITAPPGAGYRLLFRNPNSTAVGVINGLTLPPNTTVSDQNQPIDPSGIIYNSVTRAPVAGVEVTISSGGNPLPAVCLVDASQQGQVTAADGAYRFDIVPGADPACPSTETEYNISVVNPAGYVNIGVSTTLPAEVGTYDVTPCAVSPASCLLAPSAAPPVSPNPSFYYLALLLEDNDGNVVNNHIAIDPLASAASGLSKRALVTQARRGERVPYVITANDTSLALPRIVDIIPPGFDYVADSALVNGAAMEPVIAGRNLTFDNLVPNAGDDITIELTLIATVAVTTGPHVNTAQLIDPATNLVVGTARATVTVLAEHVFDCGDIIGKVFDDRNRNGSQDGDEPGLAGVRLVTVKGVLITTDKHGRFHVACADVPDADIGSNFILKLDTRTLPSGFKMTTNNPRIVRLTAGKMSKLNFGASITRMVRFNMTEEAFAAGSVKLKAQWLRAVDKLISVLETDASTLRLTYISKTKDKQLAAERMAAVEKLISERWTKQGGGYELPIETRVMGAK